MFIAYFGEILAVILEREQRTRERSDEAIMAGSLPQGLLSETVVELTHVGSENSSNSGTGDCWDNWEDESRGEGLGDVFVGGVGEEGDHERDED